MRMDITISAFRRKRVYLASPYSHPNPEMQRRRAERIDAFAAAMLMLAGSYVYSPISSCRVLAEAGRLPHDWRFWEGLDISQVDTCEMMLVLPCQDDADAHLRSTGVCAEVRRAFKMQKEVYLWNSTERVARRVDPWGLGEFRG